uniref:tRNA (guanine(46)-N(7))-methyltransferase n=2 Tax=Heterosigma akashiwo TaxID=2829 RepID=A0A7S4DB82_HETAK
MEIRPKVTEYVRLRIEALRKQNPGEYQNAAVLRTNAMRYLPNFFKKGEIEKMFFCFPDPHFKAKNHRRRIVNTALLGEYAHFLRPGGRLYAVTDVEDLHNWHVEKCTNHPCFRPLTEEEMAADPCVTLIRTETEESKKVERAGSGKYHAVFERVPDAAVRAPPFADLFRDFLPPF